MEPVHPLRRWRDKASVTLAALAARVGVTPSHLSEIERGLNAPSLGLAGRISDATDGAITANDFTVPAVKSRRRPRRAA